jgi:phosphoribosylformimino-5-aminoimidazole carboxamide ribotide isomerase
MEIIPVIDLRGGQVVRARMGARDQYRPIETPLSPTSDPVDVARGLLSVFPFRTLYVADLDAIEGTGNSAAILARLHAAFPQLTLWVDNGIAEPDAARSWLESRCDHLVIGSEAQRDDALVSLLKGNARTILSLDFRGDEFIGPQSLLAAPELWPRHVIVMTLSRVGSEEGPDITRLRNIQERSSGSLVYAAGGIRGGHDLSALRNQGIAGALVASSLHAGMLTRSDLEML